ncbi:hypothetical protein C8N43_1720 [Litoreibacter ponti]|uniref:DUF1993 domain-containing protein n=1 Tax=Litoreibacter ponti TaxID=1510457 RepID=A0A2T6BLX4_9RHOB|nr:DUF1993 family protein [Litoreibacter ponti]PTX57055.1 hypothetical protein C8N43_1720 [Litoreibacter ponti]
MNLYDAIIPVLGHYLDRTDALVGKVVHRPEVLDARLAPDMFTAAEQFATATGFALRIAYPLAGRDVPEFEDVGMDVEGLRARIAFARAALAELSPDDFENGQTRTINHRAGFAELEQDGADYALRFGLPNFLFHLTMGFAILRQSGIEIGKADFDGLHDYPQGFRF